jgi:exocyst complex component 1
MNQSVSVLNCSQVYVGRVESQLIGSDMLDVRATVDAAYEKIVQSMFDSLKQMAKMEGEGEDKGQLNYHVELVGGSCCAP